MKKINQEGIDIDLRRLLLSVGLAMNLGLLIFLFGMGQSGQIRADKVGAEYIRELEAAVKQNRDSRLTYAASNVKLPSGEVGYASWYGDPDKLRDTFYGRTTASGEPCDTFAMTAAHKTLPLGTRVRVYNRNNGRSVVVRINDRGPYIGGRVIDLVYEPARQLGMLDSGVVPVVVERID